MKSRIVPQDNRIALGITTAIIMLVGLFYTLFTKDKYIVLHANNPCYPSLDNTSYNLEGSAAVTLYLLGEIHDQNAEQVRACLASLVQSGDRLAIEYPDQGQKIPCDSIYKSYALFNGAVHCYGFDVPFDSKNRQLMQSYWLRADFINMNFEDLFKNARTSGDVIRKFETLIDTYLALPESAYPTGPGLNKNFKPDLQFYQRNFQALKKLIPKMQGLSLMELRHFIVSENHEYARKSNHYSTLARGGDTNEKLVVGISKHLKEMTGSSQRLFVVAGQNHVDPLINKKLMSVIEEGHATMVLLKR